jgi:hypothetical protein
MSTFQSDTWKFNHGVKVVQSPSPLPIIKRISKTENKSCLMLQWPPEFPYEDQIYWIVKIYSWMHIFSKKIDVWLSRADLVIKTLSISIEDFYLGKG